MVSIEKHGTDFVFEVNGLHKLWTLRSQLKIPVEHIVRAYLNEEDLTWIHGWKMPGVRIPGLLTAGTYLSKDGTIFCDITNAEKAIVVELKDEHYTKLIVEVEDPQQAVALLTGK